MNNAESKTLVKFKLALIAIILAIVLTLVFLSGKDEHHADFSFTDKAQQKFTLLKQSHRISSLNLKNEKFVNQISTSKVNYVNYWALWCEPCIDELPALLEIQKQSPNINMIFVNVDPKDKKEKADHFWASLNTQTPTFFANNEKLVYSFTVGLPYHQVFNKNKELISHFFGEIIGREKEFSQFLNTLIQM